MARQDEYRQYLKSTRWAQLRSEALTAAGNRCQVCNDVDRLQVHHRQYPKTFGEEPVSFLTVLCEKCHGLFHNKQTIKNRRGDKKTKAEKTVESKKKKSLARQRKKTKVWRSGPCRKYTEEEKAAYLRERSI